MSESKVLIRTDLSREEVFRRFSRLFASLGWDIHTYYDTVTAVDGKDFSWLLMILLIIFIWPLAIVYYLVADKNRVILLAEDDGVYKVIARGRKAIENLESLYGELKVKSVSKVKILKEKKVEEMYEELLRLYTSVYGAYRGKYELEKRIKEIMAAGPSKDEAIKQLYSKEIGR